MAGDRRLGGLLGGQRRRGRRPRWSRGWSRRRMVEATAAAGREATAMRCGDFVDGQRPVHAGCDVREPPQPRLLALGVLARALRRAAARAASRSSAPRSSVGHVRRGRGRARTWRTTRLGPASSARTSSTHAAVEHRPRARRDARGAARRAARRGRRAASGGASPSLHSASSPAGARRARRARRARARAPRGGGRWGARARAAARIERRAAGVRRVGAELVVRAAMRSRSPGGGSRRRLAGRPARRAGRARCRPRRRARRPRARTSSIAARARAA